MGTGRLPETRCSPVPSSYFHGLCTSCLPGTRSPSTVYLNITGVSPLFQNMRTWISGLALFASLVTVNCESKDTLSAEALDEKLERYIALLEKKRDAIDKFLNENYRSFNHTDFDAEEYVAHPINAYMLMKRTSVLWQIAKPVILDTASDDLWEEIKGDMA